MQLKVTKAGAAHSVARIRMQTKSQTTVGLQRNITQNHENSIVFLMDTHADSYTNLQRPKTFACFMVLEDLHEKDFRKPNKSAQRRKNTFYEKNTLFGV